LFADRRWRDRFATGIVAGLGGFRCGTSSTAAPKGALGDAYASTTIIGDHARETKQKGGP
jgi:hypothetical protein